jgi:hypothetical protein
MQQASCFARLTLCGSCAFLLLTVPMFGQFKASIQGTVKDVSGGVIPGAQVTVTSLETGRPHQTVTSEEGFYRISGLPPGRYAVAAEPEGFRKRDIQNVVLGAETARKLWTSCWSQVPSARL